MYFWVDVMVIFSNIMFLNSNVTFPGSADWSPIDVLLIQES